MKSFFIGMASFILSVFTSVLTIVALPLIWLFSLSAGIGLLIGPLLYLIASNPQTKEVGLNLILAGILSVALVVGFRKILEFLRR